MGPGGKGEVGGKMWARYPVMKKEYVEVAVLLIHISITKGPAKETWHL